jgi:hypothetical protein
MKALIGAVDALQGAVNRFQGGESWRDVVPEVEAATSGVASGRQFAASRTWVRERTLISRRAGGNGPQVKPGPQRRSTASSGFTEPQGSLSGE